jgi:hypothetical protein
VDDAPAESQVDDPPVSHEDRDESHDPDDTGADDSHDPDDTGADDSHDDPVSQVDPVGAPDTAESHEDAGADSHDGADPADSHDGEESVESHDGEDPDESHDDGGDVDSGGRPKASQRSCGAMPDEVSPAVGSQRGSVGPSPRLDSCPNR